MLLITHFLLAHTLNDFASN